MCMCTFIYLFRNDSVIHSLDQLFYIYLHGTNCSRTQDTNSEDKMPHSGDSFSSIAHEQVNKQNNSKIICHELEWWHILAL